MAKFSRFSLATLLTKAILIKLDDLKVKSMKHRKIESFSPIVEGDYRIWPQDEMDEILGRLSRLKILSKQRY
jgi:hypothetical protein